MKLWIAFGVSWILYRLDCGCDSSAILIPELVGLSKKIGVAHGNLIIWRSWRWEEQRPTNSSLVARATIILSSKNIKQHLSIDHWMDLRPPTEEMLSKLIYVKWCAELSARSDAKCGGLRDWASVKLKKDHGATWWCTDSMLAFELFSHVFSRRYQGYRKHSQESRCSLF